MDHKASSKQTWTVAASVMSRPVSLKPEGSLHVLMMQYFNEITHSLSLCT